MTSQKPKYFELSMKKCKKTNKQTPNKTLNHKHSVLPVNAEDWCLKSSNKQLLNLLQVNLNLIKSLICCSSVIMVGIWENNKTASACSQAENVQDC